MHIIRMIRITLALLILLLLLWPRTARAQSGEMMGWYFPVNLGATWFYADPANPSSTLVESVFEEVLYQGQPAYRRGQNLQDHAIVQRSFGVVRVFTIVEEGQLYDLDPDIVLGEMVDGAPFAVCFDSPCDTSLIRFWQNLDPALRSIYQMDPSYTDMIVLASYDPGYPPNLHNVVMESNLPEGVEPPAGAVTGLDFYLRGLGLVSLRDIEAATGGMVENYTLTGYSPVEDPLPRVGIHLAPGVPNPFNPSTTISFTLDRNAAVSLRIFDGAGRLVKDLLVEELRTAGRHSVVWDGTDRRGRALPSGVYVSRLESAGLVRSGRHTLLR
jgi:hypothetical protein